MSTRLTRIRSSSTGSVRTAGTVSDTAARTRSARSPSAAQNQWHDLLQRDRLHLGTDGTGLDTAHVEQVRHQVVEPIGLLLDRAQEVRLLLGRPHDLVGPQAADRRLDARQGRSEVVGHRLEQGRAQVVGLTELEDPIGLVLEPSGLHRGGQLPDEGDEHPLVGGPQGPAHHRQHAVGADLPVDVGGLRAAHDLAVGGIEVPALFGSPEQRDPRKAEGRPQVGQHLRQRPGLGQGAGQRGHGLGLDRRPGGVEAEPGHPADQDRHDHGGSQVDRQGDHLFGLGHTEPVERPGEVVVGHQDAGDRGRRGRQGTADQGNPHGGQQVEQQHRRQVQIATGVGEEEGEGGQQPDPQGPARGATPSRER